MTFLLTLWGTLGVVLLPTFLDVIPRLIKAIARLTKLWKVKIVIDHSFDILIFSLSARPRGHEKGTWLTMFIHFFCLRPLGLTIKLNTSKVAYWIRHMPFLGCLEPLAWCTTTHIKINEFNSHVNEISFSYEWMGTKTHFENEVKSNDNLGTAYCVPAYEPIDPSGQSLSWFL